MTPAEQTFRAKAPWIMSGLMADFGLDLSSAAAIVGNAGHESLGFTVLQEIKPVVAGSKGGYGWFQWTGPRRRAFEAWCRDRSLAQSSDEANYGFLVHELNTSERRALPALKAASTLRAKVVAFEDAFERAGVKAYDRRVAWAEIALDAYRASGAPRPAPDIEPPPSGPEFKPGGLAKPSIQTVMAFIIAAILTLIAFLATKGN